MATDVSIANTDNEFVTVFSGDRAIENPVKKYNRYIIIIGASVTCLIGVFNWSWNDELWQTMMSMPWGRPLSLISLTCFVMVILEMIWRISLVIRYKPIDSVSDDLLPTCTVVVPAYNEGPQVMATLKSLAASDYPHAKLQIIAVDDGSQDDTWFWIKQAKQELGGRIHAIKLSKNQGKRLALYSGFKKSTGKILVTVDSDSMVNADTLRHLTSPFVTSPTIGGIAGNVRVLNGPKGIIPRMLDVIFVFSFDFMRSSQSMVKAVMCTPGALSAYRRDILMTVVKEWLDQTFLGQQAKIGEDRAMTNLILRAGYDVLFQKNAVVYTEVPTTYTNLCKMYLRWNRSNIRESLAMCRFAFTPFRKQGLAGPRINLLLGLRSFILVPFFIVVTWALIVWQPAHFGANTLISLVIFSSIPAGFYGWKHNSFTAFWAYPYGIFRFVALMWIMPYAMMTPHKSSWLTRQVKPKSTFRIYSFKRRKSIAFPANEGEEISS